MFYILDDLGFIEAVSTHYIERENKTCTEYKGTIPTGYETLDDWVLNANIRAYKIVSGNLTYDADRDAALTAQWDATNGYGVALSKTSKNLFDKDNANVLNAYFSSGDTKITANDYNRTFYIKCNSNTTYTIRKINSKQFNAGYTYELPKAGTQVYGITWDAKTIDSNHSYVTITTDAHAQYLVCRFMQTAQDTLTQEEILSTVQIEVGSTATEFEKYHAPYIVAIDNNGDCHKVGEHYSTSEQVIGTWIDGKPLYRKVLSTGTLPNAGTKNIPYNVDNLKRILKVSGIAYNGSYGLLLPASHSTSTSTINVYVEYGTKTIGIQTFSDRSSYGEGYITIEYTKTTD